MKGLMFSLGKIIFTLLLIAGVVLLYRMMAGRRTKVAGGDKKATKGGKESPAALDLVKCGTCDNFVEAGAKACERADCPR